MAIIASGSITLTDLNDAKQLAMSIGASQGKMVIFNGASTYSPNYGTANNVLTPQLRIAGTAGDIASQATSTKWFYQFAGATPVEITADTADYALAPTGVKTLTLKSNLLTARNSIMYICEMTYVDEGTGFEILAKADIEIAKVTNGIDGTNPFSAILSNESHGIPTAFDGTSPVYTNSGTTVRLFEGGTELDYDGIGTANGKWKVVATGTGITAGAITDSGLFATFAVASAITADQASILFTITGKSANGTAINLTKTQTFNKVKAGQGATTPTLYTMMASADVLQRNLAGAYTPTALTFTSKSQLGNGAINNYNGRWVIEDTTDGTNWTARTVNPTTDEAVKTYTPSSTTVKMVRARVYLAGGTTTLLDEQTISVVSDGATGAPAIYPYAWNPDGNQVKNGEGSAKARLDIYSGTSIVTASAYKWYIQDATATTTAGGDTDGGTGWRLLTLSAPFGTTGYATTELTVTASSISGIESFKCVATYNGVKYSGVTTISDISDPIEINLFGMDKFKNGEGSVSVTAQVLRNGVELDSGGTVYTYAWSIYNSALVKTAFAKTGKTITVNATDIDSRGQLVCDVSKA